MDDLKLFASNENSLEFLIQIVRVFSNDVEIEFGVEKCAVLTMEKGKMTSKMKGLKEGGSYQYLGVIQADGMKRHEMKEKVKIEYYRRLRKILKTNLNGGNIIARINA